MDAAIDAWTGVPRRFPLESEELAVIMDQGFAATFSINFSSALPFLRRVWWPYRFEWATHNLNMAVARRELGLERLQLRERDSRKMIHDVQAEVATAVATVGGVEGNTLANAVGRELSVQIGAWRAALDAFEAHVSERQTLEIFDSLGERTVVVAATHGPTAEDRAHVVELKAQRREMEATLRDILASDEMRGADPLVAATFAMGDAYLKERNVDTDPD